MWSNKNSAQIVWMTDLSVDNQIFNNAASLWDMPQSHQLKFYYLHQQQYQHIVWKLITATTRYSLTSIWPLACLTFDSKACSWRVIDRGCLHNPSSWGLSWLFELENTEPISSVLQVNGLSGSQSFSCNQLEFTSFLLWLQEPCLPYLCKPSQVRLGLCRQKYFQELWQIDRWLCQSRSAHGEFLSDQLCFKQGSHSTL